MNVSKRSYYRKAVFGSIAYSVVFLVIAYVVTQMGLFGDVFMPDDLRIYFGTAVLGAVTLIVLYVMKRHFGGKRRR